MHRQKTMQANLKRAINGILLLNKSKGMSSNTALQKVKRLFRAKKAGHTGSLDPLATGMLPLCFGEATKLSQYLLNADKCYEATGRLGIKTSTADAEGQFIQVMSDFSVSQSMLAETLALFLGETQQIPSMFSALKHQGKPLYILARAGLEVERQPRLIDIQTLDLKEFNGIDFSIRVVCSKGTYIRNLVEDIGDKLQVGAHVTQLHRVYTAGCENLPMYTIEDLEQMSDEARLACLLPASYAVKDLPALIISMESAQLLHYGRFLEGEYAAQGTVQLFLDTGQFIGLGEVQGQELKAQRVIASLSLDS